MTDAEKSWTRTWNVGTALQHAMTLVDDLVSDPSNLDGTAPIEAVIVAYGDARAAEATTTAHSVTWIPTAERLPDTDRDVIVTVRSTAPGTPFVAMGYVSDAVWWDRSGVLIEDAHGEDCRVTAWAERSWGPYQEDV